MQIDIIVLTVPLMFREMIPLNRRSASTSQLVGVEVLLETRLPALEVQVTLVLDVTLVYARLDLSASGRKTIAIELMPLSTKTDNTQVVNRSPMITYRAI